MSETKTEPKTPKVPLTEAQQELIDTLAMHQVRLGLSDGEFTREFMLFSSTKWNKIKNGGYFNEVAKTDELFIELDQALQKIKRNSTRVAVRHASAFHKFTNFEAVIHAIDVCREKKNENRLVVYLAPTGGGKSALCRHLEDQGAAVVEANQAWDGNRTGAYYAALLDICESVGIFATNGTHQRTLQKKLIERLCKNKYTIVIDEGEFFGPKVLNLIKLLLNKTPTVFVIMAIPLAYERWNNAKNEHEAYQLRRRTHCIVTHEGITPKDASAFLKNCHLNGCLEQASVLAAQAANEFGAYDFLTRLNEALVHETSNDLESVQKAILRVKKFMGLTQGGKQ